MTDFIDAFRRACGSRALAWLIAINVLVFIWLGLTNLCCMAMGFHDELSIDLLCLSSIPKVALAKPWTLLTYMVVQYNFLHLLFNLLWLFWFGILLPEWLTDRTRVLLYIGGGLFGALCYVGVNEFWPDYYAAGSFLCGSSAAVLTIMAAAAVYSPNRSISIIFIGGVKLKWVFLACIALTFLGFRDSTVASQAAHWGGLVFGAVISLALFRRPGRRYSPRKHLPTTAQELSRIAVAKARRTVHLNVPGNSEAVTNAVAGRLSDTGRLDQLLDKIRLSGYSSLTTGERNELNALSQRLKR